MSKIRKSARGKQCLVRIPGACNFNPETTIAAHISIAGLHGMGLKANDLLTVRSCSGCHDVIDGRVKSGFSKAEIKGFLLDAMCRTLVEYEQEGLICRK